MSENDSGESNGRGVLDAVWVVLTLKVIWIVKNSAV